MTLKVIKFDINQLDLDFDPMTLILKFNLDKGKIYQHTQMKFVTSVIQKL